MNDIKHIIISQIKNIGDVVLCLPVASLIKQAMPHCKISLLSQSYTHSVAEQCSDINQLLDWPVIEKNSDQKIIEIFKELKADVIIHLSNNKRIAKLAYKAGIKNRIGTSQRLYHWLYCNKRLNQARRNSKYHELQLNAQMLAPLNIKSNYDHSQLIEIMNLTVPQIDLPKLIIAQLNQNRKQIILHPGSNGHGREWPEQHYIELAKKLDAKGYQIILTGSKKEKLRFKNLIASCPFALNSMGQLSLKQLIVLISKVELLLASGTGPVHLAAALNKAVVALFPPRKGINPRRWSPPGKKVLNLMHKRKRACFSCRKSQDCLCMKKINTAMVEAAIANLVSSQK